MTAASWVQVVLWVGELAGLAALTLALVTAAPRALQVAYGLLAVAAVCIAVGALSVG